MDRDSQEPAAQDEIEGPPATKRKPMRKPLSKRTRFEIFKRDGFRCLYCFASPGEKVLRVDHVKPVADGGTDDPTNLVTACFDCNAGKGPVPLEERKFSTGIAKEEDREHAEQIREWLKIQQEVVEAKDEVLNDLLVRWEDRVGETPPRDLRGRLRKMLPEFGVERLVEAFEIVAGNPRLYSDTAKIRYLYGILKNWRDGKEPSPAKSQSATPTTKPKSAHCLRALMAVEKAIAKINANSDAYPSIESRTEVVAVAFTRAALGGDEDMMYAQTGDCEHWPIEVRGLRLSRELTADNMVRYRVGDVEGYNPHAYAYETLKHAVDVAMYPAHEGGELKPGAPQRLIEESTEIYFWLEVFTGANGVVEYLLKNVERYPFLARWDLE